MTTDNTALIQLAMDSSGFDPEVDDPNEAITTGLFSVIVQAIQEYADRTDYILWSVLSHDIAEQFECDWINPTPSQLEYLAARQTVRNFEASGMQYGVRA